MKIFFVHAIGKSKFGGGEKWVLSAAKGLQDRGHSVYLGCRPRSVLQARAEERGIPVRPLNIISNISPYNIMKLALFLRNENIDVVLSKNRDFMVAGLAAYFAGTPAVIARHGLPMRRHIFKHKLLLNRFADGIIVNAKSTKDLYVKKGWFSEDFITVIYNGIDLDVTCDPMPFEKMYPGKKIILSIGRLSHQKGFTYLVDAAAMLKNERDDFLIIVLGEGKLRESLLHRARSAGVENLIQFPGFVKSVGPYIRGCDFFVLPSLYEGLSNAALEAMACGKPAILSNIPGTEEIITSGVNGMLVPPGDPAALAKGMSELLSDENKRSQYGKLSCRHVREYFTIEGMVKNLEQYFERALR